MGLKGEPGLLTMTQVTHTQLQLYSNLVSGFPSFQTELERLNEFY